MDTQQLRSWLDRVQRGSLSRRAFVQRLTRAVLSAPMASLLLLQHGVAPAQSLPAYKPTRRGGGGILKLLMWQGPTLLHPHLATGVKDQDGARIFYEPLAGWDAEGQLVPVLAAEIPTRENGGLSADGKSVVWRLKRNVTWHDGRPLTADDCVFTWEFARDPASAASTHGTYKNVTVSKIDSHTVRVSFERPTPFWARAFVGGVGCILPRHVFAPYAGARSREAPANLAPVGTGPYRFVEFKPGDLLRGEINPNYHVPNQPAFDGLTVKGGGDPTSAARAVLQTGEFDYAWNLGAVEDEVLRRIEAGGRGRVMLSSGGDLEWLLLNMSDPWAEVEGERGHVKSRHFAFSEPAVRQALALLVDRKSMQDFIFGRTGVATGNVVNHPIRFRSNGSRWEFNIDKANQLLDAAGWVRGGDGVRAKGGKPLKLVYQTSAGSLRQKIQAIVKQACQKAGIEVEIKAVTPTVFFSSDQANPDTYGKFWADMQTYATIMGEPDPERFMEQFARREVAQKANKWAGRNCSRWTNDEFERLSAAADLELDPVKRAALFVRMNDIVVGEHAVIPIAARLRVAGHANPLVISQPAWDLPLATLASWYREG